MHMPFMEDDHDCIEALGGEPSALGDHHNSVEDARDGKTIYSDQKKESRN